MSNYKTYSANHEIQLSSKLELLDLRGNPISKQEEQAIRRRFNIKSCSSPKSFQKLFES